MTATVYIRVSTEEQRDRQTIETQRQFAESYCRLHEIGPAEFYADDGVTGTLALEDRPAGARLLTDARDGKVGTLLIYKIDRLGRDPLLILKAVNELESLGVQIKSMTEPFDTATPSGRFMLTIMSGVAGLERETILERTEEGRKRKARMGAWLGGPAPFGYKIEENGNGLSIAIADEPLPGFDLSPADVIRMIYRLSAEEGMSCIAIAKRLTALGLPTMYDAMFKSGKVPDKPISGVWWYSRIQTVIRRETYKGIHLYGRRGKKGRELIERQVPAIVDEETWDKAQGTMHRNSIYSGRGTKRRYLLRGLIRCKHCGLRYLGCADYRGQSYHWYRCSGSTGLLSGVGIDKERCPGRSLPQSIEDVVWGDIEGFLRDPGPILEQLRQEMGSIEDQEALLRRDIGLAEKRLDARTTERERILTAFRRGTIDDAMLDQQMAAINDEHRQAEEALQALQKQLHGLQDAGTSLDSTERLLRDLNDRLDGLGDDAPSFELKRDLVELLVDRIEVETSGEGKQKRALVRVVYRFERPSGSPASSASDNVSIGNAALLNAATRRRITNPCIGVVIVRWYCLRPVDTSAAAALAARARWGRRRGTTPGTWP